MLVGFVTLGGLQNAIQKIALLSGHCETRRQTLQLQTGHAQDLFHEFEIAAIKVTKNSTNAKLPWFQHFSNIGVGEEMPIIHNHRSL